MVFSSADVTAGRPLRVDAIERTLNVDYPGMVEIRPSWFLLLEKSGYSDKIRIYHSPADTQTQVVWRATRNVDGLAGETKTQVQ